MGTACTTGSNVVNEAAPIASVGDWESANSG
ncbi:unannotated protein [freshwater metagenome]|uniref:Unannotated protein n=1 Tax=freshwater metagenome TaxID=449393 RepID=A0A6J6D7T8_9ZZZZ